MMGMLRQIVFVFLCVLLCASSVFAAAPVKNSAKEKSLGMFGTWHAYSYVEGGQSVCYMVTTKTLKSLGPPKRSPPYLMITHRPTEASIDVISYGAGAMLNAHHGVRISIGKNAFDLFSVRDTAWARDSQTDHRLAAAIKNATVAQAVGIADIKKGIKKIDDQFDLTGAGVAYHAIGKACGLPDETPKKVVVVKKKVPPKTSKKK